MMTETYASSNLALQPWHPIPTQLSPEWVDFVRTLAQESQGLPRPSHAYVLNVRYDPQRVGDTLRDWGLPELVVIAGYLRSYDEDQFRHVDLPGSDQVLSHFRWSLHYTRYIEEEVLANLLIPPYPDLGGLLIALAVHYQSLVALKERLNHQPLTGKLREKVQSAKSTLMHITKRLSLWDFKRNIEDVTEELLHPDRFAEDKQRYLRILKEDTKKIEDIRQVFETWIYKVTHVPTHVSCQYCGIAGMKRRVQDSHTTATSQKDHLNGFDLVIFAITMPTIRDCYSALAPLLQLGTIQDRLTDQIAEPKPNGYSHISLGLTLKGTAPYLQELSWLICNHETTYTCPIQIGTSITQGIMYYGCLNKIYYGLCDKSLIKSAIQISDWLSFWESEEGWMYKAIQEGIDKAYKLDEAEIKANPIIVYNKDNDFSPVSLPKGATILDFAYKTDPEMAQRVVEGFINNRKYPLYGELDAGDIVEIRTSRETQARDHWLDDKYATTEYARKHIQAVITRELHNFRSYELIREALSYYHYSLSLEELDDELRLLVTKHKLGTRQAYLELLVGKGEPPFTPEWAAQQIIQRRAEHNETQSLEMAKEADNWVPQPLFPEESTYPPRLCGTCQPAYPESQIVAYKGKNSRELVAHMLNCPHIITLNETQRTRLIPLQWQYRPPAFKVAFFVSSQDRRGLTADITKQLRRRHCSLLSLEASAILKFKKAEVRFVIEVYQYHEVTQIMSDLGTINGVITVEIDVARTAPYIYQRLREHQNEKLFLQQSTRANTWQDQLSSLGPRTTMLKNPYDISRPASPEMFYGRESELRRLTRELCEGSAGKAVVLYAPRRSGKSSLCKNFIRQRISPPSWGVFHSLQGATRFNEERVLQNIASEIATVFQDQFGRSVPDWSEDEQGDPEARFRRFIRRCLDLAPGSRLVLALDEFGGALGAYKTGILEPRFFTFWRNLLADIPQMSLLLALPTSSHTLLLSDEFPNAFSFAQNLPMPFLDQESAERLLIEPLHELRVAVPPQTVHKAVQLTGGNPYYMTLIGSQLVYVLNTNPRKQQITNEDLQLAVDHIVEAGAEQNFHYYRLELQDELEVRILEEMIEITSQTRQSMVSLRRLTKALHMPDREIRPALERLRNGLILEEHTCRRNANNPNYTFKIEIVRLWLMRNRWLFKA